ncbi:nuclear transport factor 2 family protein [Flavobacterium tistrianum]|uniref:nuclear transport factor 2 family protein n=1 Tax=Flavobacterium tistrianum TaxID=1685414 RepID=UPI000DAF14FB|nr:nuclear transport factor 2 family protein [Flavobacterium tistrianum]KAF2338227.1 nuclear transport factor 2 family protein [Flavobacterium tistrianum]
MNAEKFAKSWIESWNSHDLNDIMSHYSDDLEITTPMIKLAGGIESGSLSGKENVAAYWSKALSKFPDLEFELIDVTSGVNSVALYYKSIMDKKAVEVMFFNEEGLVNKMIAHYTDL